MVPDGWRRVPLGEVAVRVTRRNTTKNDNVLTISARDGLVSQEEYFNKRVASRDVGNYFNLKRGEFAYSKSFSQGYPAGAIKRLIKYEEGIVSPLYMCFALPAGNGVVSDFAARYLESDPFYTPLRAIAKQGARAHGLLNVRPEDFFSIPILLPPVDEQRGIAGVLQAADDAVAAAEAVIAQTEKVKRGPVEQLLTRGMPGRHTRFKMTEIGEVPESWDVVPLEAIAEVDRGKFTHRPRNEPRMYGGETPFVQTGDVTRSHGWLLKEHTQTLSAEGLGVSRLFPAGSLLVTIAANIGSVALTPYDVACPDSVVVVQPRVVEDRYWLLAELHRRQQELDARATQNAQKNINLEVLRPLLVPLPPMDERRAIGGRYCDCQTAIANATASLSQAAITRTAVAADLLSGRVRTCA